VMTGGGDDLALVIGKTNQLFMGDGNDVALVVGEKNKWRGGAGNDLIIAGGKENDLKGNDGNDIVLALGETNKVDGGSGDDVLIAIGNTNQIDGGTGNDLIVVIGQKNTLNGKAEDTTGDGNDTLIVLGMDNTIKAGRGDDWVLACGMKNVVDGGAGADTLCVVGWNNKVYGDFTAFDNGQDTILFLGGQNQVQGNGGNDLILGAGLANQIQGNSGNDVVLSAGLVQNIDLGEGDDIGVALGSFNNLLGGSGNDALYVVGAVNSAFGGDGNDFLCAWGADNVLWGQDGNDVFLSQGMAMQALVAKQLLNDGTAVINYALDTLNTVSRGLSQEGVPQNVGDYAKQGVGLVTATGGSGNDTFFSGAQATIADGGEGQDVYHFYLGDGRMTIRDNGLDANRLIIHTEGLRPSGVNIDFALSDFFFNTDTRTLSVVHAGQNYGNIVLSGFGQGQDTLNWVRADGSQSAFSLAQLSAYSATASDWTPPTSTLTAQASSFSLGHLYDDLHNALAANRVLAA
jgi:Ca2+-binding RTX toxin-like protein